MQNIDILKYKSDDPHVCTMLLTIGSDLFKIGSFEIQGNLWVLHHFVGLTLGVLPGVPLVPKEYRDLVLVKIANISSIKEIQLVFEKR